MQTNIQTIVDLAVKQCPDCFVHYAIPQRMEDRKLENGGTWYCPNGHRLIFTKTEVDKLRDQLKAEQENSAYWQNRKNEIDNQLRAKKGELTKLKNRVGKGVCPCCNRSFVNLQRHIKGQHPEFTESELVHV